MIQTTTYLSPCGELKLGAYAGRLCLCDWQTDKDRSSVERRLKRFLKTGMEEGSSTVLDDAARQLDGYFAGRRKVFTVPLLLSGTEFQQAVWRGLLGIAYGATLSYAGLERRIGRASSIRAVANANAANPLSVFVPCHRVIGSDGSLTGYAGGLAIKRRLLEIESSPILSAPCGVLF